MAPNYLSATLRAAVRERAGNCCEYCHSQERFATQRFSVEHIIPRSKGGDQVFDNLALACQGCNNHKYAKIDGYDGVNGQLVPLYHPRQQVWSAHFVWNYDCTLIIGITPTGRATVTTLHLNREGLINLRRALFRLGEHPLLYLMS